MEEILKGKEVQQPEEQPFREEKEIPEISLIAIEGHYHPTTLRMQGTCKDQNLVILIDGGSTHNFIKRLVADRLSLLVEHVPSLKVFAGNAESTECTAKCVGLPLVIQGHSFTVDTYVLNPKGVDIVLGLHWMIGLGEIRTNYTHLTVVFNMNERQWSNGC